VTPEGKARLLVALFVIALILTAIIVSARVGP